MNRIPDTHAEAWSLLPWLANGRVTPADREWLDAHVQGCAECRAELESQRQLAAQLRQDDAAAPADTQDEQRSFDKLWARIDAAEAAGSAATARTLSADGVAAGRGSRTVRWLVAAVVVQGIGLALLAAQPWRSTADPGFRTVTREESAPAPAPAPAVRIVFAPQATMADVNTLLQHQGLTLVSGPGLSGNFTATLSAEAVASGASAESVAAVIARDPHVSFAQPVAR